MNKKILAATLAAATLVSAANAAGKKAEYKVQPAENQYVLVVNGYDWGPGADKVIVNTGKTVAAKEVKATDFNVDVTMQGLDWATFSMGTIEGKRTVTAAYTSDANGNKVSGKSNYISLELSVHPADPLSNPFVFCADMVNRWSDPYEVTISNEALGITVSEMTGRVSPIADQFTMETRTYADNILLSYGAFEPAKHGDKVPLIIWCHGMGEGGVDPYISIIGNKVVNLATPEIQKLFGKDGAYVLAPQTPGFWLQTSTTGAMDTWASNPGTPSVSCYTKALMDLIETYVSENPSIDRNRIYIGGCSNGGYMTMNMIIEYPEYFAASYPVCEAYPDSKIDDEKLEKLAKQNIWLTWSSDDTTVDPNGFELPLKARLEKAGATNVHYSIFDGVFDTTGNYKDAEGNPYRYMGHWSWIYTLNNECKEGKTTIMQWLSAQHK